MSFGLTTKYLPRITSYAQAVEYWENAKPFGRDAHAARMLERRNDSTRSVRRVGDDILFRYHETDVVVWKGPDEIELNAWHSYSTATFANCLTPSGVYCRYARARDEFRVNECLAKYSIPVRLTRHDGVWHLDPSTVTRETQVVYDRKKLGQHTARVKEFLKLRTTYERMTDSPMLRINRVSVAYISKLRSWVAPVAESWQHYGMTYLGDAADVALLRAAALLDGAVTEVALPPGQVPRKSVYDALRPFI